MLCVYHQKEKSYNVHDVPVGVLQTVLEKGKKLAIDLPVTSGSGCWN